MRFQGMNSGDQRKKAPAGLRLRSPAPLVRRRPGYSSSGCTPAEPNSASPGRSKYSAENSAGQTTRELGETTVSSRRGLVRTADKLPGCIFKITVGQKGRSGTRLRRIACERKQIQVFGL